MKTEMSIQHVYTTDSDASERLCSSFKRDGAISAIVVNVSGPCYSILVVREVPESD